MDGRAKRRAAGQRCRRIQIGTRLHPAALTMVGSEVLAAIIVKNETEVGALEAEFEREICQL